MQPTIPGEKEERKKIIEMAVESVKAGDKQAYEMIIKQFQRQMYTYCFYILKNHTETEDAVQEIFIRAYENLHQYSFNISFSAWLYKMAYHHLINMKRKQRRWIKLIEHCKENKTEDLIPPHDSVLYESIAYLTAEERHILLLKAVEQYTFQEIGEIMDLKPATTRKKYERLRRKLLDRIIREGEKGHGKIVGTNGVH